MKAELLADAVLAIVKAATEPLVAEIKALKARMAQLEVLTTDDAEAIRARAAALRQSRQGES